MRGTVQERACGGQWTEAGLLLNSCRTAKSLEQHQLRARSDRMSGKLAQGRTGW